MIYVIGAAVVLILFFVLSYRSSVKKTKKFYREVIHKNGWQISAKDHTGLTEKLKQAGFFRNPAAQASGMNKIFGEKAFFPRIFNVVETGNGTLFWARHPGRVSYIYLYFFDSLQAPNLIFAPKKNRFASPQWAYPAYKNLRLEPLTTHYNVYAKNLSEAERFLTPKIQNLLPVLNDFWVLIFENKILIFRQKQGIKLDEFESHTKACQNLLKVFRQS